jgi:hypothetical protein
MLVNDPFNIIAEDFIHSFEQVESWISPLGDYRRYVGLLYNEWIVVRKFSGTRPDRYN